LLKVLFLLLRYSTLALAALIISLSTVLIQRTGPEFVQVGNMCGATGSEPCLHPQLTGGFPLAYLYDVGGISIENKLGPEDKFDFIAFAVDFSVYALVGFLAVKTVRNRARARR